MALKEWAVVVEALREGRQAILLRKGGLEDEERRFALEQPEFFLYPTYFHEHEGYVRPELRPAFQVGLAARPERDTVRFDTYGVVAESLAVSGEDFIERLAPLHVWTDEHVRKRIGYRPHDPLRVLVVRAYRLESPLRMPEQARYAGCRSWVDLDQEEASVPRRPVLDDAAFEAAAAAVREALGPTD